MNRRSFRSADAWRAAVAVLFLLLLASPALAQSKRTENTYRLDDKSTRVVGDLDKMAWMAGTWIGTSDLGDVEEMWSSPSAGSIMGAFKLIREGAPSFYEFILITEDDGGTALKLKHFHPDLVGWEEKDGMVTFRLVKLTDDAA